MSAPWHYAYPSAGKRWGRSMCCHREPKQNLEIRAGNVWTDESSVYGMDKGVTGTYCKWCRRKRA